jgi:hypothetical protein
MATWTQPAAADTYANWPTYLQSRADSQAKMFDDGVTWTSLPTNTIRWNSSNSRFEKWNGSSWVNLSTALTDVCKTANNLSDVASASTARTNLGLAAGATATLPLSLANGGTTGTDAASARTGIGCGTIATQAANAVAITGGTLSGVTALTMTSGSSLSLTSNGTVIGVSTYTAAQDITIRTTSADYWLYLQTNSVTRFTVRAAGLLPGATNTYDIGQSGSIMRDVFADRLNSGKIDHTTDIAFRISATNRWVMGGTSYEFKPAGNGTQALGGSSNYWSHTYSTNHTTEILYSKSGSAANIYLSTPGASSGNITLYATNNVDVYAGAAIRWYFGSDGKLNPWGAAPDYNVAWTGWVTTRRLPPSGSGAPTLTDVSNFVATIAADLVTLGLFS